MIKRSSILFISVLVALLVLPTDSRGIESPWALECGDGRIDAVLDDFDSVWGFCCRANDNPLIPVPMPSLVGGCHGQAMAIPYDLSNPTDLDEDSWVVFTKDVTADLSNATQLRLAIRASNPNSHDNVDVKLANANSSPFGKTLVSMTDLADWRVVYIDLNELTGSGTLDRMQIARLELGITRCKSDCEVLNNPSDPTPVAEHTGTLYVDEFAVVNLKPGAANRIAVTTYDTATPNPTIRAGAAAALLAAQRRESGRGDKLLRAWFPESAPNFNAYAQAEALLVFVYEFERTGDPDYSAAANALAAKLLTMQIQPGKLQAGAWFTGYGDAAAPFSYPDRPKPKMVPPAKCDGDETMFIENGQPTAANIDACEWAGNVGWLLIALSELRRIGIYPDATALQSAIDGAADWIEGQPAFRNDQTHPGLVTLGIEGNISAYFGLVAAGRRLQAQALGDRIFEFGWDSTQRRLKTGARAEDFATALDVAGAWGVTFLRSIGKGQEALDSLGYAVSTLRAKPFAASLHSGLSGYGDIAGPFTVTVEFGAQAVSAGIKDAPFILDQLHQLVTPAGVYTGAFPGATDHWFGGPLPAWNTTMEGVSPTAWIYFANSRDPLRELLPRRRGQITSH